MARESSPRRAAHRLDRVAIREWLDALGALAGRRLTALPHLDAFWFAWEAFNPGAPGGDLYGARRVAAGLDHRPTPRRGRPLWYSYRS